MVVVNLIENTYKDLIKDSDDPWKNSPFKNLLKLTIDARGKVGEMILNESLKSIENDNNKITLDISDKNIHADQCHYDLAFNNKTIEVKTAYKGKTGTWQHENIYKNNGSDLIAFIDFDIDNFYIALVKTTDIPFTDPNSIFGLRKRATLRSGREDGYKFDFSKVQIKELLKSNCCKIFSSTTSYEEIGLFIQERLKKLQCWNCLIK